MKKIVFFIILVINLVCFSKSITTYSNDFKPSNPELDLNLEPYFTIFQEGDVGRDGRFIEEPVGITFGDKKIYILDRMGCSVKIFDEKGDFIKSFAGKGQGPGELLHPSNIFIRGDIITVVNGSDNSFNNYTLDGVFVDKHLPPPTDKFQNISYLDDKLLLSMTSFNRIKDKALIQNNLKITDYDLNEEINISKLSTEVDMNNIDINPFDMFQYFCVSNGKIYVAENSSDYFKINVYDKKGKLCEEIERPYRRTVMTDDLKALIRGSFKSSSSKGKVVDNNDSRDMYNRAIEGIWSSENGYLWVKRPLTKEEQDEKASYFYIFKDGKYVRDYKFNFLLKRNIATFDQSFCFNGNRLYVIVDDNGEYYIKVYKIG